MSKKNLILKKKSNSNKINQMLPKPKTPLKSQFFENLKTSLFEDSINFWFDVFVLSKIAFLEGFFGFGGKVNVSI